MSLRTRLIFLPMLLLAADGLAQNVTAVSGRVTDNTQHSAPNLQVRLRPPVNSPLAGQIALTDGNGNFTFPQIQGGSYLLEVSQGPYLLFRQTLTVPSPPLNVVVQKK